jgi:hypothetical protein
MAGEGNGLEHKMPLVIGFLLFSLGGRGVVPYFTVPEELLPKELLTQVP